MGKIHLIGWLLDPSASYITGYISCKYHLVRSIISHSKNLPSPSLGFCREMSNIIFVGGLLILIRGMFAFEVSNCPKAFFCNSLFLCGPSPFLVKHFHFFLGGRSIISRKSSSLFGTFYMEEFTPWVGYWLEGPWWLAHSVVLCARYFSNYSTYPCINLTNQIKQTKYLKTFKCVKGVVDS